MIRTIHRLLAVGALLAGVGFAQVVPGSGLNPLTLPTSAIVGAIQTSTGGTINNGTLTFTLSQPAVVSGTSSVATQQTACYTSTSGSIVGIPDPLALPVTSVNLASGTLPAGTYFVTLLYNASSGSSVMSPETQVVLASQGTLNVNAPALQPASATGYNVAIGLTSGSETIQGTVTGWTQYQQSTTLIAGASPGVANSSVCNIYLSDQLEPTGTYYTVNLVTKTGSKVAGYPQTWCTYGGAAATINVANGAPTGNCNTNGVFYPTPIFARPQSGAAQSISGPLSFPGGITGPTTFSGPITDTSTFTLQNSGLFSSGQMNLYLQSLINSCDPKTEFQAFQGAGVYETEAGTYCLTVPAGTTTDFGTTLASFVNNLSNKPTAAAQFIARSGVANISLHALNLIATDEIGIPNNNYYGNEIFMVGHNAASVPVGILIDGDMTVQATNSVAALIAPPSSNHPGMFWSSGVEFYYGATTTTDANHAALNFLAVANVANSDSQGITMNPIDSGNNVFPITILGKANANLNIATSKANSGVSINAGSALQTSNQSGTGSICMATGCALVGPSLARATVAGAAPTCAFTSGGGTSPSCTVDTGSADNAGIIVATTGTGSPGGTGTITLTFSAAFGTHNPSCIYEASDGGAASWNGLAVMKDKTPSTANDLFAWTNGTVPTTLAASTAYWINYHCFAK